MGNFDTCRGALEELRVKYNATKEELLAATERQMLTDQKHEAQMKSVWARIATAENVAEELRQQYVPEDLDVLRIQIQGELEEPHKARLAELENEVLKWETLYYSVRRVYEKEKTENDLFKEQVKAAIDSDRAVFEAEVASLTGQLRELQDLQKLRVVHQRISQHRTLLLHRHLAFAVKCLNMSTCKLLPK